MTVPTRTRQPLMVMIAGPYPELGARRDAASALFALGHVPIVGEDLALPLAARSPQGSDIMSTLEEIVEPLTQRLLLRCDAVLRVPGDCDWADTVVRLARWEGKPVFHGLDEIAGWR